MYVTTLMVQNDFFFFFLLVFESYNTYYRTKLSVENVENKLQECKKKKKLIVDFERY